jgi:hypothetical protein
MMHRFSKFAFNFNLRPCTGDLVELLDVSLVTAEKVVFAVVRRCTLRR